jgi:hypothetical protein
VPGGVPIGPLDAKWLQGVVFDGLRILRMLASGV